MADYCASEVIAGSCFEKAVLRRQSVAALYMEVFRVNMIGIRSQPSDGNLGSLVGAKEVAYINKYAEIVVTYAVYQLFNPSASWQK